MQKCKPKTWLWYLVLSALVTGLFAPTMIANAVDVNAPSRCVLPPSGDILN